MKREHPMAESSLEWQASDGLVLRGRFWEPPPDVETARGGAPSGESPEDAASTLPPVCVIHHGLGEHSGRYGALAEQLVSAGYRVLAFDARGHGVSDGPPVYASGYSQLRADLRSAFVQARRRCPNLPLVLIAHSWGGGVALSELLSSSKSSDPSSGLSSEDSHQVAAAVVIGPLLRPAHPAPAWKVMLAKLVARVAPRMLFSTTVDPAALSRDPRIGEAFMADPLCRTAVSARMGVDMLSEGERLLEIILHRPCSVPLLLMHGEDDAITDLHASSQLIADWKRQSDAAPCEWRGWPGARHELFNETNRAEIVAFTIQWINNVLVRPAQ